MTFKNLFTVLFSLLFFSSTQALSTTSDYSVCNKLTGEKKMMCFATLGFLLSDSNHNVNMTPLCELLDQTNLLQTASNKYLAKIANFYHESLQSFYFDLEGQKRLLGKNHRLPKDFKSEFYEKINSTSTPNQASYLPIENYYVTRNPDVVSGISTKYYCLRALSSISDSN